jgi:formimidoylglutamate deiminase
MAPVEPARAQQLWAPQAWVDGRWQRDVTLAVDAQGCWGEIVAHSAPPDGALRLPGPALPGLVDAHSHAFQRAFAGLAEQRLGEQDDFWSWRDRMYGVALTITPERLGALAAQLYRELLRGGYTQVCEFHYLHHAIDGTTYPDPLAMSRALVQAAVESGIGLTLLPVLYERAGFTQPALGEPQRRFRTSVEDVIALRDGVRALRARNVNAGCAIHSLRAAAPESIAALVKHLTGDDAPIHIHVAEQTAEVQACQAATGCRPVEWLARHVELDPRWQLIHATHATRQEIAVVAARAAGVVLCPATEANLGDGLPDLAGWLDAGVALSIGSDSQVTRDWREELRLLEYGQRLTLRRRNVAAAPALQQPSTAGRLFDRMLHGGAAAAGLSRWGLVAGARADLLLVDRHDDALRDIDVEHTLDALVFSSPVRPFAAVMVAGRWVVPMGALDEPTR